MSYSKAIDDLDTLGDVIERLTAAATVAGELLELEAEENTPAQLVEAIDTLGDELEEWSTTYKACGIRLRALRSRLNKRAELVEQRLADAAEEKLEADQVDELERLFGRTCRICGCTQDRACMDEGGVPCHWVQADLCSGCAVPIELAVELSAGDETEVPGELLELEEGS